MNESFPDALNRIAQNDYLIDQHLLPEGDMLIDAADRIEALEAEVERLTAELAQAHAGWDQDSAARHRLLKEVRAARAALDTTEKEGT